MFQKIEEELAELREAVAEGQSPEDQALELGDLLFAVSNVARFIKADPEEALTRTNRKFVARFRYIEEQLEAQGKSVQDSSLQEMESLWQSAKRILSSNGDGTP